MNLKNYTSSIPASTTIANIEVILSQNGVSKIGKEYSDTGLPEALMFVIEINGERTSVRLPANIDKVQDMFWEDYKKSSTDRARKTRQHFREQAVRTAWKIQLDWVQVQISLIRINKTDFRQAFMGFIWDGTETYFDRELRTGGLKMLPEST